MIFYFLSLFVLLISNGFSQESLVIIGGGPAGLTAAIYAGRFNLKPLLIEGTPPDTMPPYWIENYPGFPEGIDRHELIERLRAQAIQSGAVIKKGWVQSLHPLNPSFQIELSTGETLESRSIIIATGRKKRSLGVEGEDALFGRGIGSCAFCEAPLYEGKEVVVIGHDESALEQLSLMSDWAKKVTLVTEEEELNASKEAIEKIKLNKKVTYLFNTKVVAISDLKKNEFTGIWIKEKGSKNQRFIPASGLFIALGFTPNTEFVKEILELDEDGYIKTAETSSKTTLKGIFAAGDAADPFLHQLIFAAASGAKAAIEARAFLIK